MQPFCSGFLMCPYKNENVICIVLITIHVAYRNKHLFIFQVVIIYHKHHAQYTDDAIQCVILDAVLY